MLDDPHLRRGRGRCASGSDFRVKATPTPARRAGHDPRARGARRRRQRRLARSQVPAPTVAVPSSAPMAATDAFVPEGARFPPTGAGAVPSRMRPPLCRWTGGGGRVRRDGEQALDRTRLGRARPCWCPRLSNAGRNSGRTATGPAFRPRGPQVLCATASDLLRRRALPVGPGVSRTHGQPVEARLATGRRRSPRRPSSPSPTSAWRSRLEPRPSGESLRCSEPRRSRPTLRRRTRRAPRSGPRRCGCRSPRRTGGTSPGTRPRRVVAAGRLDQRGQLVERAPERAAGARGVLEVQRAALALGQRLARSPRPRARSPAPTSPVFAEPGCSTTACGAERVARAQRGGQRRQRLGADLGVLGGGVEQVDGVDQQRVDAAAAIASRNAATCSSE